LSAKFLKTQSKLFIDVFAVFIIVCDCRISWCFLLVGHQLVGQWGI